MKILATSDTHFSFDSADWPDADVFIHAGDLMYEGLVAEWNIRQASLTAVNAPVKIYVPGNHDYYPFHYEGLAASQLRKEAGVIMAMTLKIGGGRFSALDSSTSPNRKPGISSHARMLTVSEKRSLRDFASKGVAVVGQRYVVTRTGNGRFIFSAPKK